MDIYTLYNNNILWMNICNKQNSDPYSQTTPSLQQLFDY